MISANKGNYYIGLYDRDNNEVISEQFNNVEYISKLIAEYNPVIVSNDKMNILNKDIEKIKLDIINIVDYYQDKESENVHLVVPNYLKLPQALEEKK